MKRMCILHLVVLLSPAIAASSQSQTTTGGTEKAVYTDVKATVFGDTAIATGGFKAKGTDAMGKPFDNNERCTDTWMKMPKVNGNV